MRAQTTEKLPIFTAALATAVLASSLALPATASAETAGDVSPVAIAPLTSAAASPPNGYFSDPFPIVFPRGPDSLPVQIFSGTTPTLLACLDKVPTTCLEGGHIVLDPGVIAERADRAGTKLNAQAPENLNIGFDADGRLQMAATYSVTGGVPAATWHVIVHAHPDNALLPLRWTADALLVGSLSRPGGADYDGKYIVDDGRLYLVHSAVVSSSPARFGLVAQLMIDARRPAATPPVLLLAPASGNGFVSEDFLEGQKPNGFKLLETGNITKIGGKYAIAYSTGTYDEADYKAGIAWSDTFLPKPGQTYRKVLQPDPGHVWGTAGGMEVRYLLQSEKPAWPNDVAAVVLAPGVPSILQAPDGAWRLVVAGYSPSNAPTETLPGGRVAFIGAYRRPYAVPLQVAVPPDATVAGATDAELAHWVTPVATGG